MKKIFLLIGFLSSHSFCQDTISYQWPVTPFATSQSITGTFCEFRNTLSSNHFHNGADIPKADNSPVYAVLNGQVTDISPEGTSAYVRIKGTVNGVSKNIAYVHIAPNPSLTLGQQVTKGVTILGNILTGQGHTHLVDGAFNYETNPLRKAGGLEPYVDTWKPKVLSVEFYQDNSSVKFTNNKVYGLFDIVAQLVEVNANAIPNSGSTSNNGVYHTGYKIYAADKSSVVYNPGVDGVRYKFDWKPNDASSNVVYTLSSSTSQHIYYLTNGTGNIGTSRLQSVDNSAFSSALLPAGQYQVMVYAQDTHGNADTVFVPFEISTQDLAAPAPPVLKSVLNDSTNRITVNWYPNTEPDLKGYRLYSSLNGTSWSLQKNEAVLKPAMTSYSFKGITSTTPVYFRMTAVDSAAITNESELSDSYGLRPNLTGKKVLVVDAFDRNGGSGSYSKLFHPFALIAGQSIAIRFETIHNRAVTDGSVSLSGYNAVLWMFGDESSTDETFGTNEQAKAAAYLKTGGNLFVSGSEVAYDLDRLSGPTQSDRDFLNTYLKADYAGDASGSYSVIGSGIMSAISFGYGDTVQGSPYREDYPDYLSVFGGSSIVASYGNGLGAMTAFSGTFAGGSSPGAVALLALPFETIHTNVERDAVMGAVLKYFGITTSVVEQNAGSIPTEYTLEQNYPNPFNPTTIIRFALSSSFQLLGKEQRSAGTIERVTLDMYNVLGEKVTTLVDEEMMPGTYSVQWNGSGCASGVYFYRLRTKNFSATKSLVLLK
ncbi:MAG: hypothetical protein WCX28_08510 [Bacteriovoracaceae bacterium]|nr:hypothetical protein [Bacteroidota bacterium]